MTAFGNGVAEAVNALSPERCRRVVYMNFERAPWIRLDDGRCFEWVDGEWHARRPRLDR